MTQPDYEALTASERFNYEQERYSQKDMDEACQAAAKEAAESMRDRAVAELRVFYSLALSHEARLRLEDLEKTIAALSIAGGGEG